MTTGYDKSAALMDTKVIKSTCGHCQAGCGVLISREGDQIVNITGDPDSPVNRGVLCSKGLASLDYLHLGVDFPNV